MAKVDKKQSASFAERKKITIAAPNFQQATFEIKGNAPLVVKRMSQKLKQELRDKIALGSQPKSKKRVFEARDLDEIYNAARYVSKEGWDGFPAGAIRAALIRACSVIEGGPKMTHMKMSIFVEPDGWDKLEPQIPLIRIYGSKPARQEDIGRIGMSGDPQLIIRPVYHNWSAKLQVRWDGDQFALEDVYNLLLRVGLQVGIMEGRPFSRNSTGQGWGTFDVVRKNIELVRGRTA